MSFATKNQLVAFAASASFVTLVSACADEPPPPAEYPSPPAASAPPPANPPPAQGDEELQIGADDNNYADTDPSAINDFRPAVEGHGAWVDDATYGTVWVPNGAEVGPDFVPYQTGGHWVYDNDDYVWVSDYDWGWAPYHYGRWIYIDGSGWAWIPGRRYAGAWVTWRTGPAGYEYVGWGPMPPAFGWYGGVAVVYYARPEPRYVYCARGDVFAPGIAAHVVTGERAAAIARDTHPYVAEGGGAHADSRGLAQPVAHGPAPSSLGIEPSRVAHGSPSDPHVARAQSYATPQTAQAAGAHAPTQHVVRAQTAPAQGYHPPAAAPPKPTAPRRGRR